MSGGRFASVNHLTILGGAMHFGKKYPMSAVVLLIQRLAFVYVVLTGAMFTQLAGSRVVCGKFCKFARRAAAMAGW
jgi:hypothetical protein